MDAWETIGQAIGTSGENCKNKMITLLSCYRSERMKIKKSNGTGKGMKRLFSNIFHKCVTITMFLTLIGIVYKMWYNNINVLLQELQRYIKVNGLLLMQCHFY